MPETYLLTDEHRTIVIATNKINEHYWLYDSKNGSGVYLHT